MNAHARKKTREELRVELGGEADDDEPKAKRAKKEKGGQKKAADGGRGKSKSKTASE